MDDRDDLDDPVARDCTEGGHLLFEAVVAGADGVTWVFPLPVTSIRCVWGVAWDVVWDTPEEACSRDTPNTPNESSCRNISSFSTQKRSSKA